MNLLILFIEFLKIGLFSFGGAYASIPLYKETVLSHEWLSEAEFYNFIGVCESTPGPIMVNLATYIGTTLYGPVGAIIATLAVILPAFIIILILAAIITKFLNNKHVKGIMAGIQPIVIGLILSAAVTLIIKMSITTDESFSFDVVSIICLAILFILYFLYKKIRNRKIPTIPFIIVAAVVGIVIGSLNLC